MESASEPAPAPEEPAAEAPAPAPEPTKKRRRWSEPVAQPADPPPALPGTTALSPGAGINPALIVMAPALSSLFNRPAAAQAAAANAPVDGSAHELAQDALRRVQQMVGGGGGVAEGGGLAGSGLAGGVATRETLEININECRNKGQLTKKATQEEITRECGVAIRICGRYKPPGDTSTDEPPLYLR